MKKPLREYLADLTEFVNVNRILRIGRRATKKAQEDNRRMGIPNVYSINGQLYYELPNGELTTEDPMSGQHAAAALATSHASMDEEDSNPEHAPDETSTETDKLATDAHDAADEDLLDAPVASHSGKNGSVIKPKTPAAISDPAVDTDV